MVTLFKCLAMLFSLAYAFAGFRLSSGFCFGKDDLCFDWRVSKDKLTLTCRIFRLIHKVFIKDPHGVTQGICILQDPAAACDSSLKNATLSLNYTTNLAIFEMHGKIDRNVNGVWTCGHGTGRDIAKCNVTVSEIEDRTKNLMTEKNDTSEDLSNDNLAEITETNYGLFVGLIITALCIGVVVGFTIRLVWGKKCKKKDKNKPKDNGEGIELNVINNRTAGGQPEGDENNGLLGESNVSKATEVRNKEEGNNVERVLVERTPATSSNGDERDRILFESDESTANAKPMGDEGDDLLPESDDTADSAV